jgi:N6-adenosine-specific RNA methylase IME4
MSQGEASAVLSVSADTIQFSRTVLDRGAPELAALADAGEVKASTAAKIAKNVPVAEQQAILAQLPRDDAGKLTPEAKKEIRKVAREVRAEDQAVKKQKRDERERKLGAKIMALPQIKAGLIISDFEWHFKVRSEDTGMDRHAANHYVTAREAQTPEAIVERQRERMSIAADDCIHLMWVPASFSAIAHKVVELQGFKYVSQLAWIKPGIGTGFWIRDCHELLFICVRGKIPCPAQGTQFDSAIPAPKGEHSEKPDFAHEFAETFFPSLPKVEFNARRARPGWIAVGNEAPEPEQGGLALEQQSEAAE